MSNLYDNPGTRMMFAAIMKSAESAKASGYLQRIDDTIRGLSAAQRERFLRGQIDRWDRLQAQFHRTDGDSQPAMTQWDFSSILDGLAERHVKAAREMG